MPILDIYWGSKKQSGKNMSRRIWSYKTSVVGGISKCQQEFRGQLKGGWNKNPWHAYMLTNAKHTKSTPPKYKKGWFGKCVSSFKHAYFGYPIVRFQGVIIPKWSCNHINMTHLYLPTSNLIQYPHATSCFHFMQYCQTCGVVFKTKLNNSISKCKVMN